MGGLFKHFDCWSWRHLLCPPIDLSWPMTWAPKQNSFPRLSRCLTQMSHFCFIRSKTTATARRTNVKVAPVGLITSGLWNWNHETTSSQHFVYITLRLLLFWWPVKRLLLPCFRSQIIAGKKKSDKKKWILFKIWICSSVSPVHFCGRCNTQDDGWKWNSLSMNRRHTLWPVQIGLREI